MHKFELMIEDLAHISVVVATMVVMVVVVVVVHGLYNYIVSCACKLYV